MICYKVLSMNWLEIRIAKAKLFKAAMTAIASVTKALGAPEAKKAIAKKSKVFIKGVWVSSLTLLDSIRLQEFLLRFFQQKALGGINEIF